MNTHVKSMASAAVIIADIIAGIAAPAVFRHHPAHASMAGAYGLYVVLAVATLCVARYLTTPARPAGKGKPAQRSYIPGGYR